MDDIDVRNLPALESDATLDALIETFNARLIAAHDDHSYVGSWTPTIKVGPGDADTLTLPTVRLVVATGKDELERARATLFAAHLLQAGRDTARQLWQQAAPHEGERFMAWVRADVEWKRAKQ